MDALKIRWVMVAVFAALLVRIPAITSLPIDWDEPIYMEAATEAAEAIHASDWSRVVQPTVNREHPALVKIVYGVALAAAGPDPSLVERLAVLRSVSLVGGLLLIGIVAWAHPVAGIVLATHTIHAKYSVQVYLESLPLVWMSVAMLIGWRHRERMETGAGLLVAACWAAACAGKWLHGVPGLVLLVAIPAWSARVRFVLLTALCFWVLDPSLWIGPLDRIAEMTNLHASYAASDAPPSSWWTPWVHLGGGGPSQWHPTAFPYSIDGLWLALAALGLGMKIASPWVRFVAAWWAVPMAFMMVWGTRWPQHTMAVVVPVCLLAAVGMRELFSLASRHFGPTERHPPASS